MAATHCNYNIINVCPLGNVTFCVVLQDPRLCQDLESRGTGSIESRTFTVVSGLNFVDINCTHFTAADAKTCKVGRLVALAPVEGHTASRVHSQP